MLDSLLGWQDQAKGLANWYQNGKATADSDVLALLKTHWDEDGMLDYYCAWHWNPKDAFFTPDQISPTEMGKISRFAGEDWWRTFKRRSRIMEHDPFYGGTNPLHLGYSESFGVVPEPITSDVDLFFSQKKLMQTVLVVKSIESWKSELAVVSELLPPVDKGRSWRIKIFEQSTGFLGEFRQSRVTGKWFTGKHSIHMMGN